MTKDQLTLEVAAAKAAFDELEAASEKYTFAWNACMFIGRKVKYRPRDFGSNGYQHSVGEVVYYDTDPNSSTDWVTIRKPDGNNESVPIGDVLVFEIVD